MRKFLPYLPREIPLFAAVTISFWGIAEVLAEIGGERVALKDLAIPALATSLVVAVYKAIQKYRAYVPEPLTLESNATRAIFRKGAYGWQFALAHQMLLERISTFDRTLGRVESGAEYIPPKSLEPPEYLKWLKGRPEILLRLVRCVAIQCTSDLPHVLIKTKDECDLFDLKDSISRLASLYNEAKDFELECRSVKPADKLSAIHEMVYGWSAPIRDGVRKFMSILSVIATIDPKEFNAGTLELPAFSIEFASPANVDAFVEKLGSLDASALSE